MKLNNVKKLYPKFISNILIHFFFTYNHIFTKKKLSDK